MLTSAWTQLRYHEQQSQLWRTASRFVAVAAGRGSGKTELARRRVVRMLPVKKQWQSPMYFYALPTRAQAKRVAWDEIKALIPRDWIYGRPSESEMVIRTRFGSSLHVVGMDKPQRIEGNQWDGGVVDESCDQKPKSFDLSILPALSHRSGWCWRIGVPKRFGCGAADFRRFAMREDVDSYSWRSDTVLTEDQLEWAKENLDERDFEEQYGASWQDASGLIFWAFSHEHNVKNFEYDPELPLVIGSDFNVDPMAWVVCQVRNIDELYVLDEIWLRNTNTQRTLDALFLRWGHKHLAGYEFYGDASGASRKTSAASSDYVQIVNDERFRPRVIRYPKANPSVADRFASMNALMCSASQRRRLFIHPRCKNLIADIDTRAYVEGTRQADDHDDIGHITDALGYVVHKKFPVKVRQQESSTGVFIS